MTRDCTLGKATGFNLDLLCKLLESVLKGRNFVLLFLSSFQLAGMMA